jgi:transposase
MMGYQSKQIEMPLLTIDDLVPKNHLLMKIDSMVDFGFIYELAEPYYHLAGRPSIMPKVSRNNENYIVYRGTSNSQEDPVASEPVDAWEP